MSCVAVFLCWGLYFSLTEVDTFLPVTTKGIVFLVVVLKSDLRSTR